MKKFATFLCLLTMLCSCACSGDGAANVSPGATSAPSADTSANHSYATSANGSNSALPDSLGQGANEIQNISQTTPLDIDMTITIVESENGTAKNTVWNVKLSDNSSAEALVQKLKEGPVTLLMHDYGSFEKVGELPFSLPRNDEQITTEPGDVILYQGNQITFYYDTNSWSFTRLGKI